MSGRIFKPFTVGSFVMIPAGEPFGGAGIPLVLGRKGAFGSGEHETTASCLEELEHLPVAGMRCIDLGSGTGILAIAAARLGAASVVAVDIDPAAARSCAANIDLNQARGQVLPLCGELACIRNDSFDLLLANIYAEVHLALAADMVTMVRAGGYLLLSGIPTQDNFDILRCFQRHGCELLQSRYLEEFVTFVFRRNEA